MQRLILGWESSTVKRMKSTSNGPFSTSTTTNWFYLLHGYCWVSINSSVTDHKDLWINKMSPRSHKIWWKRAWRDPRQPLNAALPHQQFPNKEIWRNQNFVALVTGHMVQQIEMLSCCPCCICVALVAVVVPYRCCCVIIPCYCCCVVVIPPPVICLCLVLHPHLVLCTRLVLCLVGLVSSASGSTSLSIIASSLHRTTLSSIASRSSVASLSGIASSSDVVASCFTVSSGSMSFQELSWLCGQGIGSSPRLRHTWLAAARGRQPINPWNQLVPPPPWELSWLRIPYCRSLLHSTCAYLLNRLCPLLETNYIKFSLVVVERTE